jgi:hypothetical protein
LVNQYCKLYYSTQVPKVFGQVKAKAQGSGMALLQVGSLFLLFRFNITALNNCFQLHTEVNVEHPWQLAPLPNGSFFDLSVEHLLFHGKNNSIMDMTVCARYINSALLRMVCRNASPTYCRGIGQSPELAVLEIGMPTGYIATNDVLRKYVQSHEVPGLRRAEQIGSNVHFYLQNVSHSYGFFTPDFCMNIHAHYRPNHAVFAGKITIVI